MRWFWKKTVPLADLYKADELFSKARDLYIKKLYKEALPYLEQILESVPEYAPAYSLKGLIELEFQAFEDAVKSFNEALSRNENYAEAYHGRGTAHVNLKNWDAAISDLTEAIKRVPGASRGYAVRAYCWLMKGEWDKLIFDANQALRWDRKNFTLYRFIGYAFCKKGDSDSALKNYDKALEINPKDGYTYFARGMVYSYELFDQKRALRDFNRAFVLGVDNEPAFYCSRGFSFYREADYDRALEDGIKAMRLDSKVAQAYNLCAYAYMRKGDFVSAFEQAEKVMEISPLVGHTTKGVLYVHSSDFDAALEAYNEAFEIDNQAVFVLGNRGELFFAQSRYLDAQADYEAAYKIKKNDPFARAGLAITHHALGNMGEAERFWKLLLELNPQFQDMDYLKRQLGWLDPLVEEARKVAQKFAE